MTPDQNLSKPLKGHALWGLEGWRIYGAPHCECGARPDRLLSGAATREWHRKHKALLRSELLEGDT